MYIVHFMLSVLNQSKTHSHGTFIFLSEIAFLNLITGDDSRIHVILEKAIAIIKNR